MNINAVLVCVDCSDVLAWTLPSIRTCFDKMVVVTTKTDEKTKKICNFWYVDYIETDLFYKDGAKFNKGLAIQLGLDYLQSDDWVVNIDADIYLPPRFNEFIRCKNYNKDCIYGIDRLDVKDWNTWINFISSPSSQHYIGSVWATFPLMYRVCQGQNYSPVGFFQMWHSKTKYAKNGYPISSPNAADSDLKFSGNFPPENRILIPEVFAYHLSSESQSSNIGVDWNGRVTKPFGPNND